MMYAVTRGGKVAKVKAKSKAKAKGMEPKVKADAKPKAKGIEPEVKADVKPKAKGIEPKVKADAKPKAKGKSTARWAGELGTTGAADGGSARKRPAAKMEAGIKLCRRRDMACGTCQTMLA